MTVDELYEYGVRELKTADIDCAESDMKNIFYYALNIDSSAFMVRRQNKIKDSEYKIISDIIGKRKTHVPLQYIFEKWEFMGIEFKVGEGVLIPREDTSILVNSSLSFLETKQNPVIADLCSGSGCVAIAVEKYFKNCPCVYAIEISPVAFKYLENNIKINSSDVIALNKDIFKACNNYKIDFFDAVVCNPPYIKTNDIKNLQKEVKFEPILALDGGKTGLDFYEKICDTWLSKIKNGGIIAFEVGYDQAESVKKLLKKHEIKNTHVVKDINNIDRVVIGIK